jgi:hypothetical protein
MADAILTGRKSTELRWPERSAFNRESVGLHVVHSGNPNIVSGIGGRGEYDAYVALARDERRRLVEREVHAHRTAVLDHGHDEPDRDPPRSKRDPARSRERLRASFQGPRKRRAYRACRPTGPRAVHQSNYTHIPLRAKDTGTKLERLFASYTSAAPPVHQRQLGKILFCKMLQGIYPGIGPHKKTRRARSVGCTCCRRPDTKRRAACLGCFLAQKTTRIFHALCTRSLRRSCLGS